MQKTTSGQFFTQFKQHFKAKIWLVACFLLPGLANSQVAITEFLNNTNGDENTLEYIELFNFCANTIDLENWTISDEDSDNATLPTFSLLSGGYVVLVKDKSAFEAEWFGGMAQSNVLEVAFGALANSSDEIILKNSSGDVVWSLAYANDESSGRATFLTSTDLASIASSYGNKAAPGVVRAGDDNGIMDFLGYEENDGTVDPNAITSAGAAMDTGSPGCGSYMVGAPDLQITEMWPGQAGTDITEDWFEIANNSNCPWVSGVDGDLFYDDDSQDPGAADQIFGITDIKPGEKVIVVLGIVDDATAFRTVWEEVIDLAGVEVGHTDGSGLGQGGDGVTLWIGDPTVMGNETPVDFEAYPDANGFSGVSYNVELASFSVAGENGAVATLVTGGNSGNEPAIGSPGDQEAIEVVPELVINEVDADTESTDELEFVELYDGGLGNTALDGFVLVFFNGSDDASYEAFDLDGFSTNADGYFVIGNTAVPNVDLTFPNNGLQNGADAVALYTGDATDFPNDTPISTTNLIDAVVYDTNDGDDAGLLPLLNAGQPQLNEDENDDKDFHSLQRIPNGSGGLRNTDAFLAIPPTPGAENKVPPAILITEIMYNPASSENDWEWVEIYNTTDEPIDLAGYVFYDDDGSTSDSNIPGGILAPGGSAILYNAEDITAEAKNRFKVRYDVEVNDDSPRQVGAAPSAKR